MKFYSSFSSFYSFKSVVEGNHTLFREYSYIQKTPHNKASFIQVFWKCFRHIGKNGGNNESFASVVPVNHNYGNHVRSVCLVLQGFSINFETNLVILVFSFMQIRYNSG